MLLNDNITRHHAVDDPGTVDHSIVYNTMMNYYEKLKLGKGAWFRQLLCDAVTPSGNIYRLIGLRFEARKHSFYIQMQMQEIADTHPYLLAESSDTETDDIDQNIASENAKAEARLKKMIEALGKAKVTIRNTFDLEAEPETTSTGFPPIEEFCQMKISPSWWMLPEDPMDLAEVLRGLVLTFLILLIQTVVPVIILVNAWYEPHNHLLEFENFQSTFNYHEIFCLGLTTQDQLHTIMGVLLMELVIVIIHSYVAVQWENARVSAYLPTSRSWYVVGNLVNIHCNVVILLIIPLLFWTEAGATQIALDSLTLLFLQTLDDLDGYALSYMRKNDHDYCQDAAWHIAMLSRCPVNIKELINPDADGPDDLWDIQFENKQLQASVREGEEKRKCICRLEQRGRDTDETSPLRPSQADVAALETEYRIVDEQQVSVLPRPEGASLSMMWHITYYFVLIGAFVLPAVWMVVNKRCGARAPV